jgi:enterochelin esterase-like enzyme
VDYPVIYLLHGNSGNHLSWSGLGIEGTTDALIASGEIPAVIIVMPEASTTWYVNRKEQIELAILEELIPAVESGFRVESDRQSRFIGGYSMGGYGAMRFALKYPELFGGAALLSPAIYNPLPPLDSSARRVGVFGAESFNPEDWQSLNYPALWQDFLAKGISVPMYINSGDDDQFFIEAEATAFYSLLRRNNQPAELRIVNGGHTGEVWASTIDDAMRYLLNR